MASGGSAKDWANYTGGTVDGTDYSAEHWANVALSGATGMVTYGTRGSPQAITAGGGITYNGNAREMQFIQGSGAAVNITATPQISAGTTVGSILMMIGRSSTNTVTFENGTGLSLNGTCVLGEDETIEFVWDGTNWLETGRNT